MPKPRKHTFSLISHSDQQTRLFQTTRDIDLTGDLKDALPVFMDGYNEVLKHVPRGMTRPLVAIDVRKGRKTWKQVSMGIGYYQGSSQLLMSDMEMVFIALKEGLNDLSLKEKLEKRNDRRRFIREVRKDPAKALMHADREVRLAAIKVLGMKQKDVE